MKEHLILVVAERAALVDRVAAGPLEIVFKIAPPSSSSDLNMRPSHTDATKRELVSANSRSRGSSSSSDTCRIGHDRHRR